MAFNKDLNPSLKNLEAEFAASGLPLNAKEARLFWQLHELLEKRNPEGDLTRVSGFYNTVYKHYIDGALAARLLKNPEGLTMDLGTGAGFPGLPIAIMRPELPLLLAEPRGRRLAFMEEAVELLGLQNIEFYPHKVGPRFDRNINNFITRDFESVAASIERGALIIPPEGRIYLMKGPKADAEVRQAAEMPQWNDFELEEDLSYSLGASGLGRRFLVFRKKKTASRPAPPPPYRIIEIASKENQRYKSWLKSLSGRGLKKSEQAVISGPKFVREIVAEHSRDVAGLIIRRTDDLKDLDVPEGMMVYLTRPELFPDLDIYKAGPPLALLNIPEMPVWDGKLSREKLTVFLPFQDPANLGTAIRTATAMGAAIVLLKDAANPWHAKSLRASGPSLLSAELRLGPSLEELAHSAPSGLFALSPKGQNILSFTPPAETGFVFGIEGPGLGSIWPADKCLSIPMAPGVESLNAAAAVAVALGIWAAKH